jgi:catechol 2,3-dioxygenase-like lactoylglutathione lyase family enzyme
MMILDHVVVWVDDPLKSLAFYVDMVGLTPVRSEEFQRGEVPFPSVRVSPESIIDLTAKSGADSVDQLTKADGSAGHPVNHLCLTMERDQYNALKSRLDSAGLETAAMNRRTYGAQGWSPEAFYFKDPDGNVVEARYYETE